MMGAAGDSGWLRGGDIFGRWPLLSSTANTNTTSERWVEYCDYGWTAQHRTCKAKEEDGKSGAGCREYKRKGASFTYARIASAYGSGHGSRELRLSKHACGL